MEANPTYPKDNKDIPNLFFKSIKKLSLYRITSEWKGQEINPLIKGSSDETPSPGLNIILNECGVDYVEI